MIAQLRQRHPELFVMPELPPWPRGLQKALRTPDEAVCRTRRGVDLGDGSWVPEDRGRATQERLLAFEAYPARAQATVDALMPRVVVAISERAVAEAQGYSLRTVIMWTLVGLAIGSAGTAVVVVAN